MKKNYGYLRVKNLHIETLIRYGQRLGRNACSLRTPRHTSLAMHSKMKVKFRTNSSVISFSLFFERWSDWSSNLQPSGGNSFGQRCPFLSIPCKISEQNGLHFPFSTKEWNSPPNPNLTYFPPVLALLQYSVATSVEVFLKHF